MKQRKRDEGRKGKGKQLINKQVKGIEKKYDNKKKRVKGRERKREIKLVNIEESEERELVRERKGGTQGEESKEGEGKGGEGEL